jgi:hypothetical protein
MNEQILVHLQGGLGNQMFQYAAALAVSQQTKSTVQILCICSPNKHNRLNHKYVGDLFHELLELEGIVWNDDLCQYSQSNAFERWNPKFLPSCSPLFLNGYFQYLPAIECAIPFLQETFLHRLFASIPTPRILPNGSQSAFLHVRRGDYLNHPTYHWAQDIDYYKKGIEYVQKQNPYIYKWYVFSDDLEWCREQPLFNSPRIELIQEENEYQALALMIQCQGGAVIANSTFSWWGAMLGADSSKKPVVYPLKWCGQETVILFPQAWRGL